MEDIEFKALRHGPILLTLIDEDNLRDVREMFNGYPDSKYMLGELERSCSPRYDEDGLRTKYGFYVYFEKELAGLSLLGIDSWRHRRGYTGADILIHMRGKGIASLTKPPLFHLAFKILCLNRVETGCFVSNISSKKSIEKTPGFKLEGILRQYCRNENGIFEDEYRYSILRSEWANLYKNTKVEIIDSLCI